MCAKKKSVKVSRLNDSTLCFRYSVYIRTSLRAQKKERRGDIVRYVLCVSCLTLMMSSTLYGLMSSKNGKTLKGALNVSPVMR